MKNATKIQIKIAKKLGFDVSKDSSIIAAAKIESTVFEAIRPDKKRKVATENQVRFLRELGCEMEYDDFLIVSAQIENELQNRNLAAILRMDLKPGDNVLTKHFGMEQVDTISSIGRNNRIWFKGGRGRGCWPSQVIKKVES